MIEFITQSHGRSAPLLALFRPSFSDPRFLPFEEPESGAGFSREASRKFILVVEDNRADVFLVERAAEIHKVRACIQVINDGEEAIKYIDSADAGAAPSPDLVLLDLNLPKRSGSEVLRRWRSSGRCANVPVIVFTSSDSAEDRRMAAKLGAARYFRKPMKYDEFLRIGEMMKEVLAERGRAGHA